MNMSAPENKWHAPCLSIAPSTSDNYCKSQLSLSHPMIALLVSSCDTSSLPINTPSSLSFKGFTKVPLTKIFRKYLNHGESKQMISLLILLSNPRPFYSINLQSSHSTKIFFNPLNGSLILFSNKSFEKV